LQILLWFGDEQQATVHVKKALGSEARSGGCVNPTHPHTNHARSPRFRVFCSLLRTPFNRCVSPGSGKTILLLFPVSAQVSAVQCLRGGWGVGGKRRKWLFI